MPYSQHVQTTRCLTGSMKTDLRVYAAMKKVHVVKTLSRHAGGRSFACMPPSDKACVYTLIARLCLVLTLRCVTITRVPLSAHFLRLVRHGECCWSLPSLRSPRARTTGGAYDALASNVGGRLLQTTPRHLHAENPPQNWQNNTLGRNSRKKLESRKNINLLKAEILLYTRHPQLCVYCP